MYVHSSKKLKIKMCKFAMSTMSHEGKYWKKITHIYTRSCICTSSFSHLHGVIIILHVCDIKMHYGVHLCIHFTFSIIMHNEMHFTACNYARHVFFMHTFVSLYLQIYNPFVFNFASIFSSSHFFHHFLAAFYFFKGLIIA